MKRCQTNVFCAEQDRFVRLINGQAVRGRSSCHQETMNSNFQHMNESEKSGVCVREIWREQTRQSQEDATLAFGSSQPKVFLPESIQQYNDDEFWEPIFAKGNTTTAVSLAGPETIELLCISSSKNNRTNHNKIHEPCIECGYIFAGG